MTRLTRWIALLSATALGACASGNRAPTSVVLKTSDFIADPATMPTTLPAAAPRAPSMGVQREPARLPSRPAIDVSAGMRDVVVAPGPAPAGPWLPASAAETPTLIDAKVGEINGRPIRIRDFESTEARVARAASEGQEKQAELVQRTGSSTLPNGRTLREEWVDFASRLFRIELDGILRDELLAAEARADLEPQFRMGLRAFVEEATNTQRRTAGGSNAQLERQLRAKNQSQQQFGKQLEANMLIQKNLEDNVESRVRASWKDIKRYYQRNLDRFKPPAIARFRMITVPQDNATGVQEVQAALDRGDAFDKVAALSVNEYNSSGGGLLGDGATLVEEPYDRAEPFSTHELNEAARSLKPGAFTRAPVAGADSSGKVQLTWLYLESLTSRAKSLGDPDVQISIANDLTSKATQAGTDAYIARLVKRATYNDIDAMVRRLSEVMADRYWPAGS